ncbi:hypothetical protein B0H14DRAFT_3032062 [Mycena olivaceomarginata]|nr:hypothetical protein B0H14DRAFT_3032062 [Mycena olivaceomarginata]
MPPTLGTDIGTRETKELWVGVWWKWWESLQPEERTLQDNNELLRPREVNWSEMAGLYGDNGILQVMATLVWWGEVAHKHGKAEIEGWRAAVDDVTWVLERLLECEDVGRKNTTGDDDGADEDQPPRKRKRQANPGAEPQEPRRASRLHKDSAPDTRRTRSTSGYVYGGSKDEPQR